MSRFARYSTVIACLCLVTSSACRSRSGNGGDELPADVQKAIDEVVAQLETTSQVVAGSVEAFASVDLDSDDEFGDCPEVIFIRDGNVSRFGLTFEPGCESEYFEGDSVSGSISIVFDRNTDSFDADFDEFTVDGQSTTGDLHVSRTEGGDLRTWSGSIDLTTAGVATVVGDITLVINVVTSTITIESALLQIETSAEQTRIVEIEGLVIRPVANGNFIPQAGTVTIEVPNDDDTGPETVTIVVEFDAESPFDRTVRVTINDGTVEDYPLGAL